MKLAAKEDKKSIGEQLVDAEIISPGQLAEALGVQKKEGGSVVVILMSFNHLTPAKVDEFLASRPGVPSIELHNYSVPREVTSFIPRDFAIKHQVFPIDKMGKLLTVGMAFPLDAETIAHIEEKCSLRVKAFLCNPDDIRRAVEHYYLPESTLLTQTPSAERISAGARVENVALLVQKIDGLPALPETVRKVQEASHRTDVSLKEIADIVAQDPVISARLLKLANSPAYGFKHMVDNVELAVSLLGIKEISMAVLSSAVIDMTEKAGSFDCAAFSRRSMLYAGAARQIGALCGFKKSPGIFTAGLLCEIGRFALARCAPARYEKIPGGLEDSGLCDIEEKLFGIGHPEAGYLVADHWELPTELSEPIRYHLAPERATSCPTQTAVIALAARLGDAHLQGMTDAKMVLDGFDGLLLQLNLSAETAMKIYAELGSETS
jgi:HD-like signal output (HDOD) protein